MMKLSVESKNDNWRGVLRPAWLVFERQVLVFPLLVLFLSCVSFFFGGRCAVWQWWMSVLAVVGSPFFHRRRWREAGVAAGLFAVLLFALRCLLPPVTWDNAGCSDMPVCHLPMIQLFVEGWNPVTDPLADDIMGTLDLDFWGMAPVHVVFCNKAMAVFAAVAYHFVGDPTALTVPGLAFLWLGVALVAMRVFHGFSRWVALSAMVFVLPMVVHRMPVDLEVAFASCGLLFTMQDALRKKDCDWVSLAVWGAWMMNLKATGLLASLVFFAAFIVAKCRRERAEWKRWTGRFAMFGAILAMLWGIISWNPFGTSWLTFGHPLYPYATVDAARFPVCNLTSDMHGNEDAQAMGKMGAFAHAYLSPELTKTFFRWRFGRDDFSPQCSWWDRSEFPSSSVRVALWTMFAILFFLPHGRPWGLCGLVLLAIMPNGQIGFTRYQPWLSALGCLAMAMVAERIEATMGQRGVRWISSAVAVGLALAGGLWGWHHARDVEYKARELSLVRERVRPRTWLNGRGPSGNDKPTAVSKGVALQRYNYLTCMLNRTRLLIREMGREGKTAILPTTGMSQDLGFDWVERDWPDIAGKWRQTDPDAISRISWREFSVWDGMSDDSDVEAWMREPAGWYWIPLNESAAHVIEYYTVAEPRAGETATGRLWRRMKYCVNAWGETYPHEVWLWLTGQKWKH
jgi:hypothetical protein